MKNIIFVSKISPLSESTSSTDITTINMIEGFNQLKLKIILIAIVPDDDQKYLNKINDELKDKVSKIYYVKTPIKKYKNKYLQLFSIIKSFFQKNYFQEFIRKINIRVEDDTILISQSPPLESLFFCREFLKNYHIKWTQYWSDPFTLNGINPENYTFKRYYRKYIEETFLKLSDDIIYAPKTLYFFQKEFFPKFAYKMRYVDVSYLDNSMIDSDILKANNRYVYSGSFFKYTRNIKNLFDAFKELGDDYKLDVYGQGDIFPTSNNVELKGKKTAKEIEKIECSYKNMICLMNSNCIQIPGKIFYRMNEKQNILIIADGRHKKELSQYLESFDRFVIVNNDKNSIKEGIKKLEHEPIKDKKRKEIIIEYSTKKIASDIIKK